MKMVLFGEAVVLTKMRTRLIHRPAGILTAGLTKPMLSGMLGLNKAWGYSHLNFSYFKDNIGFFDAEPGDNLYNDNTSRTLDYPSRISATIKWR
jgi:hypothetical protein